MTTRNRLLGIWSTLLCTLASAHAGQSDCSEWTRGFEGSGVNLPVSCFAVFEPAGDSAGLYLGGRFTDAGGLVANHVLRWDGSNWSALANGVDDNVSALAVFDDGAGAALYAAGAFEHAGNQAVAHIARWDGDAWSPLGAGLDGEVFALCVFDDGSGAALYAAGAFTTAGGGPAAHIARWDGVSWSALSSGTDQPVRSLCVLDDAGTPRLCAGGEFTSAGGNSANFIARWDGTSWSPFSSGMNNWVRALAVYGNQLHAAGEFTTAGGNTANWIARWNGAAWTKLAYEYDLNGPVFSLASWNSPSGTMLVAGGDFSAADAQPAQRIARWNGLNWAALGTGSGLRVTALAAFDDGELAGDTLYVAGSQQDANNLARWNGSSWLRVGPDLGIGGEVKAFEAFDDGNGLALYAGGAITRAGEVDAHLIARWDGHTWSALGSGLSGTIGFNPSFVLSMHVYDGGQGGGPALYVAGRFKTAGSVTAYNIARWDGQDWSAVGTGIHPGFTSYVHVDALASFDAGAGIALYAGGYLGDGTTLTGLVKWDGTSWTGIEGLSHPSNPPEANALLRFDDGTGSRLYVAGRFDVVDGRPSNNIARWDGSAWSSVGGGLPQYAPIQQLLAFDDGTGAHLYAASTVGIWRFDGASWNLLPAGSGRLAVFDDGATGSSLYLSSTTGLARFDGSAWIPVADALGGATLQPAAVLPYADGAGESLYVGGYFNKAGSLLSHNIARWRGCGAGLSFCFGDGLDALVTTPCPCANWGAAGHGCANSINASGGILEESGSKLVDPNTGTDSIVLTASRILSTSIFLQGDATQSNGVTFGDGIRCAAGQLIRLAAKISVGGVSQFPEPGDESLSQRGGVTIGSGETRYYQTWYRNPNPTFCPPATFNITNGVSIEW